MDLRRRPQTLRFVRAQRQPVAPRSRRQNNHTLVTAQGRPALPHWQPRTPSEIADEGADIFYESFTQQVVLRIDLNSVERACAARHRDQLEAATLWARITNSVRKLASHPPRSRDRFPTESVDGRPSHCSFFMPPILRVSILDSDERAAALNEQYGEFYEYAKKALNACRYD